MRTFKELLAERPVLFDGGTGTEIYSRGVFINHCYEELNLSRPELVEDVHRTFLGAGADAVETNTFSGNRPRLEQHGLGDKVRDINREGAHVARRAAGTHALVAGSLGPLGIRLEPWGPTTVGEAEALFREQIEGLVEGGVDLLVLETFTDLVEIQAAVRAAKSVCDLPVIAMMTVDEEGRTPEGVLPEWVARKLEATGAEVVGVNCSVGPAPMLSVVEAMASVCARPLAAMPNAGIPRSIDGRVHYLTNPTYMARYARRFVEAGARVVGGCCGVTPEHIRAMREMLGQGAPKEAAARVTVDPPRALPRPPARAAEKSRLARRLAEGGFVTLVELPPPRGWETGPARDQVRAIAACGVDGIVVPDDPRVRARLSPLAMALLVQEEARISAGALEAVLQYTCRDRSLLGMQSDLLGAHALGIRNLQLVTGQAPRPGEAVWSTPIFDVDAIGLTNVVFRLNHGLDVADNAIGEPTRYLSGALAAVGLPDQKEEVDRFGWKVDAGAEYAITTPVFDVTELARYLAAIEGFRIPVIATIWPPRSLREAEYLAAEVPGVRVPQAVLERMARAGSPAAEESEALQIAAELLEQLRPHVEGVMLTGRLGRDPRGLALLAGVIGTPAPQPRAFPGRPGIKGGAAWSQLGDGGPSSR